MFWLRNKKNNFQIHILVWRPVDAISTKILCAGSYDPVILQISFMLYLYLEQININIDVIGVSLMPTFMMPLPVSTHLLLQKSKLLVVPRNDGRALYYLFCLS